MTKKMQKNTQMCQSYCLLSDDDPILVYIGLYPRLKQNDPFLSTECGLWTHNPCFLQIVFKKRNISEHKNSHICFVHIEIPDSRCFFLFFFLEYLNAVLYLKPIWNIDMDKTDILCSLRCCVF